MSAVLEAAKPADELLQACAAFHRVHAEYIGPYVSDAHTEKLAEVRGEGQGRGPGLRRRVAGAYTSRPASQGRGRPFGYHARRGRST